MSSPTPAAAPHAPRSGERFPDLVLPDQTGSVIDLHAARAGRNALIVFYRSARW